MTADSPRTAQSMQQMSPEDLLSGFARSHVVRWFMVALLLHAIVIGGFSVGTIRDWLDPEGAKARKAALAAAAKAPSAPADAAASRATPGGADGAASAAAKAGGPQPGATTAAGDAKTPIEKATSEAAKPDEIPSSPDDLGLSIDDTNPK